MAKWTEMFDRRLDVQPPVGPDQLAEIPAKRGVVALLAEGDQPIVLLTAADIRARVRNRLAPRDDQTRKKSTDLRGITRAVLWKLAAGHFETDLHFFELSRRIWPADYTKRLAWKPAWFVHVDAQGRYPHFSRTREVFAAGGRYFGPFAGGRAADAFVEALQDAFDLCRELRHLRQAPRGSRCAYAQIGRCLCPCDGSISMDAYRRVVARAADYAAGTRDDYRRQLQRQMKGAAAELQFERAGSVKVRLQRLDLLESAALSQVAPAERFQRLLVQPDRTRQGKVFLVDRGRVRRGPDLAYPLRQGQLARTLKAMAAFVASGAGVTDEAGRWRMGLVCSYLFSSESRQGLMLPWDASMTPEQLRESIESAAGRLGLRAPKPRRPKSAQPGTDAGRDDTRPDAAPSAPQ